MRRSHVLAAAAALSLVAVGLASAQTPVEAAPTSLHFTAAGVYDATASTTTVLNGMKAAAPDLNLALGDLAYASSNEYTWCDFVKSKVGNGFPFELISGNHESYGLNGSINNFSACLPNQLPGVVGTYGREWYVDVPAQSPLIRFIMISPGLTFPEGTWPYSAGDAHYRWTSDAIDGARGANIPWVVVGMHEPCIAMGEHQCDSGPDITNLLLSKKVDLVLTGHEHYYARTKQLRLASGCTGLVPGTYDSDCVGDTDADLLKGSGTVIVTAGTGGTPVRDIKLADSEMPYLATWSAANVSPSYGFLDVTADADTLSAHFTPTSGVYTDAFTISTTSTPPANQPPTAVVAAPQCTELVCGFDGTGSSDPDGTITSYAWDFGDGASSSAATPSHTYANAGTYTVALTVTDDDGASDTATRTVTVTAGGQQPLASDAFTRTVASGWGSADVGGPWTVSSSARTSVSSGTGQLLMASAGSTTWARLLGVSTTSSDLLLSMTVDKPQVSSGTYATVVGRLVPGGGEYRAKFRLKAAGVVQVSLDRSNAIGAETNVQPAVTVSGLTLVPGQLMNVRMQVTGTSPTAIRVKAWPAGGTEPSAWTASATDSTSALQAAGGVGVMAYLSSAATNAPVTLLVDDLQVTPVAP
jgi:PKD repeat protein